MANEETDRVEDDAYTKMDKDIADTLISAVRDSEETATESGDVHTTSAPEPSVTEPAEVASAQTSSSKDAASLEHDDLLVVHAEPVMAVLMDEEEELIDDIKRIESPTSEEKDAAATRIQASYRGYQVRKTNEAQDAEIANMFAPWNASQTEPCISWNGARAVDQESGELVTGDEDESVWATLEREIEETKAATKIQAGFRGHKARQGLLQREDAVQVVTSSDDVAATTPFSGVRHTGEFHDSLPLLPLAGDGPTDGDCSATKLALFEAHNNHVEDDDMMSSSSGNFLDRAATKIQSTYRGFKTRNDLRKERSPVNSQEPRLPPMMLRVQSAPQILIQDSVEDRSAAKIQAGVRGYLTRQRLKRERSPQPPPTPEVEDAVVKIQAGFRGYKARQEVKSMREGKDS
ncbi:hypothetical protein B566_EDAN009561 [Ephemera danica]|nr:hypothetical protein B566_EDAN009561 [Ephemera danica]